MCWGDERRVFGTGTFNTKSLIAVRLLDAAADVALDAPSLPAS